MQSWHVRWASFRISSIGVGVSTFTAWSISRGAVHWESGLTAHSSLIYGHESLKRPLSSTIQRVTVDVDTDNLIASLGVGPQLTLGHGALRPYLYGTVGFSYFATVSSASGTADAGSFASSTNFDDVTAALTAGGGLLLRISRGMHPVSLDLSAQKTYHGETTYLRKGSLLESPDGSISFIPIRSEANLVTFRIGVAIGV